jgi:hypothetical protein
VSEEDMLSFTDDDIEFQVHNIKEMICNAERHDNDDQYKKMIKDFKISFYHGCAVQYMRLFTMVKLFQLKASNGWSDGSFKDLLTLLKDILP